MGNTDKGQKKPQSGTDIESTSDGKPSKSSRKRKRVVKTDKGQKKPRSETDNESHGKLEDWHSCEIVKPMVRGVASNRATTEEYKLLSLRNYAEYGIDGNGRLVRVETTIVYKQVLLD